MPTIAIVDDRKSVRETIRQNFEFHLPKNWSCIAIAPLAKPSDYIPWILRHDIQVIVIDWVLDEQAEDVDQAASYKGNAVVTAIRSHLPELPVFVITAHSGDEDLKEHVGDVERILTRREFTENAEQLIKPMLRAGERFAKQFQEDLNELTKLSVKVAVGKATRTERARLNAIQTTLGLLPDLQLDASRSEMLDQFEKKLKEFDTVKRQITNALSKRKKT